RGRVGEGVAARKKADRRAPIARPPPPPLPTRGGEPTRRDSCREILPAVRPIRHRRGRAPAGTSMAGTEDEGGLAEPSAHYLGHRKRLRDRFLAAGADALADYELLEMILFGARPRGDMKPLAKQLLRRFGSFPEVIAAPPELLRKIDGVGDAVIAEFKLVQAAATRLMRAEVTRRPV